MQNSVASSIAAKGWRYKAAVVVARIFQAMYILGEWAILLPL